MSDLSGTTWPARDWLLPVLCSAAVHVAVVLAIWPSHPAQTAPPPAHSGSAEPEAVQATLMRSDPASSEDCESYTGIGVATAGTLVIQVALGGPADKAGVRIGDHLINGGDTHPNKYPVGHVLRLHIERDDKIIGVDAKVDNICFGR